MQTQEQLQHEINVAISDFWDLWMAFADQHPEMGPDTWLATFASLSAKVIHFLGSGDEDRCEQIINLEMERLKFAVEMLRKLEAPKSTYLQ